VELSSQIAYANLPPGWKREVSWTRAGGERDGGGLVGSERSFDGSKR